MCLLPYRGAAHRCAAFPFNTTTNGLRSNRQLDGPYRWDVKEQRKSVPTSAPRHADRRIGHVRLAKPLDEQSGSAQRVDVGLNGTVLADERHLQPAANHVILVTGSSEIGTFDHERRLGIVSVEPPRRG